MSDQILNTDRQREARDLRERGLSWAEVGRALGVSRQRAQQAAYPEADRSRRRAYARKKASRIGGKR